MKIICDWKNCKEIGAYKAPVERDNSKKFRLLCLKHIKLFMMGQSKKVVDYILLGTYLQLKL